jgi:D-tyrosyl-tRNA(Tyr) deacylase
LISAILARGPPRAEERGHDRLFDRLLAAVKTMGIPTATGQFGADMQLTLTNDGPVTFLLDSRPSRR